MSNTNLTDVVPIVPTVSTGGWTQANNNAWYQYTLTDPYTRLLTQLSGDVRMSILKKELGESLVYYRRIMELNDLSGIQARLPYFIDIR